MNGTCVASLLDTRCIKSIMHPRCVQAFNYLPWKITYNKASSHSIQFPAGRLVLQVKGGKQNELAVGLSEYIKTDTLMEQDILQFCRYLKEAMNAGDHQGTIILLPRKEINPPILTTIELALAIMRAQEKVQAQRKQESNAQVTLNEKIISASEPNDRETMWKVEIWRNLIVKTILGTFDCQCRSFQIHYNFRHH